MDLELVAVLFQVGRWIHSVRILLFVLHQAEFRYERTAQEFSRRPMFAPHRVPNNDQGHPDANPRPTPRQARDRDEQQHRHGELDRDRPQMTVIRRIPSLVPIPRLRRKRPQLAETVRQFRPEAPCHERRVPPVVVHEPETDKRRRHAGQVQPQPAPKHGRRERGVQIGVVTRARQPQRLQR